MAEFRFQWPDNNGYLVVEKNGNTLLFSSTTRATAARRLDITIATSEGSPQVSQVIRVTQRSGSFSLAFSSSFDVVDSQQT